MVDPNGVTEVMWQSSVWVHALPCSQAPCPTRGSESEEKYGVGGAPHLGSFGVRFGVVQCGVVRSEIRRGEGGVPSCESAAAPRPSHRQ